MKLHQSGYGEEMIRRGDGTVVKGGITSGMGRWREVETASWRVRWRDGKVIEECSNIGDGTVEGN